MCEASSMHFPAPSLEISPCVGPAGMLYGSMRTAGGRSGGVPTCGRRN